LIKKIYSAHESWLNIIMNCTSQLEARTNLLTVFTPTFNASLVHITLYCVFLHLRQWPTWYTIALFYNTFIMIHYMFRALYAHHQEGELYWCSIWYPCTATNYILVILDHSLVFRVMIQDAAYNTIQYNSTSWWWAYNARNM
jgi:hypothetical protein